MAAETFDHFRLTNRRFHEARVPVARTCLPFVATILATTRFQPLSLVTSRHQSLVHCDLCAGLSFLLP